MASLFVTLRLTGHVSNGEAREFVARLTDLAEAADLVGIEVKQSVDVRLDPEPQADPLPAGGFVLPESLTLIGDGTPEAIVPLEPEA